MTQPTTATCAHCGLPAGLRPYERQLGGKALAFCCYGCCLALQVMRGRHDEGDAVRYLIRLGIGVFFAMFIMIFSLLIYTDAIPASDAILRRPLDIILFILTTPVVVLLGGPFFNGAWQSLRKARLSSDSLLSLAVVTGYVFSAVQVITGGYAIYFDTLTMVLLVFTFGRYLEARGRAKAVQDLEEALGLGDQWAHLLQAGTQRNVKAVEIMEGNRLCILPGERIPVDGVVEQGASEIDEAMLTGESRPVAKQSGDRVFAGTTNNYGTLRIRCERTLDNSRWATLGKLVRTALAHRAPLENLADRISTYFLPAVIAIAAASAGFWLAHDQSSRALSAALAVLVVACPCALGLAIPLASSLGISGALRYGIVVRRDALGKLRAIRTIAIDKTGTLTCGRPRIASVLPAPTSSAAALLRIGTALAVGSEHPLARALAAGTKHRNVTPALDTRATPGSGITGLVDGLPVAMGSRHFVASVLEDGESDDRTPAPDSEADVATHVWVAAAGRLLGSIGFVDTPRSEAHDVIRALKSKGLRVVMLSGDHKASARNIAAATGIPEFHAGLSPRKKLAAVNRLNGETPMVAMIGDGLNDAPVLAAAHVGIAVAESTGLAKVSAQIVLPTDGLAQLPWLIDWSKQVYRVSITNLAWALLYNVVALGIATTGMLQPVLAAALMAGSSAMVLINSSQLQYRGRRNCHRGTSGPAETPPPETNASLSDAHWTRTHVH